MATVHAVAIVSTALVLLVVLELVRRRRLVERYALLWMLMAIAMLVLALLRDAVLDPLAELIGIATPVNLLFLAGFAIVFVIVLNFSVAISRLSEESKILAQEVARLEQELRVARGELPGGDGTGEARAGGEAELGERAEAAQAPSRRSAASTSDQ